MFSGGLKVTPNVLQTDESFELIESGGGGSGLACAAFRSLRGGCPGAETHPEMQRQQAELSDIYDIYQHFVKSRQKAPTQMSDLTQKQYEGTSPGAVNSLKQGKYLIRSRFKT